MLHTHFCTYVIRRICGALKLPQTLKNIRVLFFACWTPGPMPSPCVTTHKSIKLLFFASLLHPLIYKQHHQFISIWCALLKAIYKIIDEHSAVIAHQDKRNWRRYTVPFLTSRHRMHDESSDRRDARPTHRTTLTVIRAEIRTLRTTHITQPPLTTLSIAILRSCS